MMTTDWQWIVPFKGRYHSGATNQNFLCRSGEVFVMDNHRAALWCWLQAQDLSKQHSLIHIDRHTDTLTSRLKEWRAHLPDWSSGIEGYLGSEFTTGGCTMPVIQWDNYLSIYLAEFGENLKRLRFLTHDEGDPPNFEGTLFSQPWELPENLSYWLDPSYGPWIVNIDLDYFYCPREAEGETARMFSDEYVDLTFIALKQAMDNGAVGAVTLCLTPDGYTPGWDATEALATRALKHLGLDWRLP
jgi:UPF0489 domain